MCAFLPPAPWRYKEVSEKPSPFSDGSTIAYEDFRTNLGLIVK